ncbi:sulfate transporter family-domain-containing protein [Aspergillus karnatakaensis]|uniref:sulfate transporter family-domain-containing protein n=1 Tax=Aspergillus karnatakaensis TaxID=1810916 RepID=UPI003CCCCDAF
MGHIQALKKTVRDDPNITRFLSLASSSLPKLPKATANYLAAKVPIAQWITGYSPSWLWGDLVAGITIGILLVPQSLAYAKVANIPARYGLISSWLPTLFYTVMGTSKDVTAGPTAIMGLLTGEIVTDLVSEGYSAAAIASAAAFWVGIYSLLLGLLKLGFLLEFIPLPVLSGYVSGAAITIVLQQLKGLFGQGKSGSDTAGVIRVFFQRLPNTNWRAFLIGFSGIILLLALQFVGRKWGKKYRALWYLSISRNALALIIFTAISYGVNKSHPDDPLFGISQVTGAGILAPKKPDSALLVKVAGRSVAVFIAAALEHLAIGKAFGRRHGYVIEQDQELNYIGLVNLFGSFFSCMPVTGGFSRTAVNSESGVKSPLSGLATTACVLVSIYKLTDAFYWIPSATLSAIIVVAVWQIILPARVFWHYWKTSFADFVGSMVAFWVTLFVDVEIGIAAAVGYSLVYVLLHLAFTNVTMVTGENLTSFYPGALSNEDEAADTERVGSTPLSLPEDTMLFILRDSILYPNASRTARQITNYIYTYSSGAHESSSDRNQPSTAEKSPTRLWNDTKTRHIANLRREAGTLHTNTLGESGNSSLPALRTVIIDMTCVTHVDTTGMQALADIRSTLKDWAGAGAEVKFVGLNERVKERFRRAESCFLSSAEEGGKGAQDGGYVVFDALQTALTSKSESENADTDVDAGSTATTRVEGGAGKGVKGG